MLCAALGWQAGAAQTAGAPTPADTVECVAADGIDTVCRADLNIYIGWRVFQAQCAMCHAADANGSSFAPDLTQRMVGMTERQFFTALDRGYLGPRSTMPPRGRDPNVAPYYDELWAYLKARRDGVLPAGAVEPQPN